MKITVRTMQHNSETKIIEVADGLLTVGELRRNCADAFFVPSHTSSHIFLRGAALNNEDERANIKPGDTVLVDFQPSSSIQNQTTKTKTMGIPSSSSSSSFASLNRLQQSLLRKRNKKGRGLFSLLSPNISRLLIIICSTTAIRFILGTLLWCYVAKMAYNYDLGPIFVLCSLFYLMFTNLSNDMMNKDGRLSAYSMFNKNFETLPGNFDANAVERNVRHNHDNMT